MRLFVSCGGLARKPLKLYSGSDGMYVRTDENPKVFVLCGFRRPGAKARGEARKKSKKRRSTTFQQSHTYYIYRPDAVNTMLDMRA